MLITECGRLAVAAHARSAVRYGASLAGHAGRCRTELGFPGGCWPVREGDRLLQRRDRHRGACALLLLYCAYWGCHPGPVRPRIRYCSTPAGRVAYSTWGAGPPLLFDSGWITDLRGQLELAAFGSFVGRLAEQFSVIRYDKPGCGLSDRDGIDLSFDGQVAAALAVADAVGAGRFRLFGASQGGQLAAAVAARYPERVEALVLYGMCASGRDLAPAGVRDSVVALVRAHWGLGLKALAGAFVTDPTAEELEAFTRFQRASASAAVAARLLEVYYDTDIRALLPAIRARTAVLHREADKGTRFELGREVAALIPGATLIPLPGSSHVFYHGDWLAVLDAVLGFLCEPASAGPRLTGRELEVAGLVAEGLTNQAIARRLSVAPRTAEAHVENIRRKLQVHSRAQIAAWVTEHRLRPGAAR
jgi:pimeloyl-ACP methyl ester carboxylesterase/DNA-binding CsgD family transcriptional regulator